MIVLIVFILSYRKVFHRHNNSECDLFEKYSAFYTYYVASLQAMVATKGLNSEYFYLFYSAFNKAYCSSKKTIVSL